MPRRVQSTREACCARRAIPHERSPIGCAFAAEAELPVRLRDVGAQEEDLPALATAAATEWTGTFNPRAFDAAGALEIYAAAF